MLLHSYATMYPYTGTPTLLALRHEDGYAPSFMVFGGGVSRRHRATLTKLCILWERAALFCLILSQRSSNCLCLCHV